MRGRTVAFLLFLAVLPTGFGAQEDPAEAPPARESTIIQEVRLEGNAALKSRDLLEAAGLLQAKKYFLWRERLALTREEVEERLGEIVLFYQRRGYFQAGASLSRVEDGVAFAEVTEKEPARVAGVRLELEPPATWGPVSAQALLAALPLKAGDIFAVQAYEDAQNTLARTWKEGGFPFPDVSPEAVVDQMEHSVEVTYRVTPGEALAVGDISFEGAEGLEEKVLRRAMLLRKGEPWRQSLADKSGEDLFRLGLFEAVSILPDPSRVAEGRVPVVVRLRQGMAQRIKVGGGYGTEDGARLRFGWETARLDDKILTFGVDAKISQQESSGLVFARRPYFRNPFTTVQADVYLGDRDELDYSYRSVKARLGFDRAFGDHWKWGLYAAGEKLLRVSPTADLAAAVPQAAMDLSILTSVMLSGTLDTRNNPVNPTHGIVLSGIIEPISVDTGRRSFLRALAEGRAYFSPASRLVVAMKLKVGALLTGGNPDDIPLSQRFYAGGSMSVRGYRYNGLGQLAENGALLGGDTLVESSLELRFPVKGDVGGLFFVDAGNALGSNVKVRNFKLYCGTGFGVRVNTPVGPVGVDLGFKLRKDPRDSSAWALHVFVGYAF